jgi:hypothetical protein
MPPPIAIARNGFGGGAARVFEFDDLCGAAIGGEPVLHFLGGWGEGGHW